MRTRDAEKQQRIKEAVVQLILREGIEGASVSKIAREAGVSPATIYVYYDSKEAMLAEVFAEYAHLSYRYLMRRIRPEAGGAELIDSIVRGWFSFSIEHEEVFSFVEQCSRCPSLSERVSECDCCTDMFDLIHEYQRRGVLKSYSDRNLEAVLFSPVRYLAANRPRRESEADAELSELVRMLQELLLM